MPSVRRWDYNTEDIRTLFPHSQWLKFSWECKQNLDPKIMFEETLTERQDVSHQQKAGSSCYLKGRDNTANRTEMLAISTASTDFITGLGMPLFST